MRSWVQVLETTSCRNAGKGCVYKTQSGRALPQTLCTGLPFFSQSLFVLQIYLRSISRELYVRLATFVAMYIELTSFCAPQMHPLFGRVIMFTTPLFALCFLLLWLQPLILTLVLLALTYGVPLLSISRLLVLWEHRRQLCIRMTFCCFQISYCPLNLLGKYDMLRNERF
jgi:hypothetical protein